MDWVITQQPFDEVEDGGDGDEEVFIPRLEFEKPGRCDCE